MRDTKHYRNLMARNLEESTMTTYEIHGTYVIDYRDGQPHDTELLAWHPGESKWIRTDGIDGVVLTMFSRQEAEQIIAAMTDDDRRDMLNIHIDEYTPEED